jgi:hypothetical protein
MPRFRDVHVVARIRAGNVPDADGRPVSNLKISPIRAETDGGAETPPPPFDGLSGQQSSAGLDKDINLTDQKGLCSQRLTPHRLPGLMTVHHSICMARSPAPAARSAGLSALRLRLHGGCQPLNRHPEGTSPRGIVAEHVEA